MAKVAKTTRKRPVRSSTVRRDILKVEGKDDDFMYRIVNDEPGRVAAMKDRGYEIADGDEEFISSMDDGPTKVGSIKSKHVGGGKNAVLMRIPKEWFEEDKRAKEEHVDRLEQKTTTSDIKGGYGKVDFK